MPAPEGDCKSTKPVENGVKILLKNNAVKHYTKFIPDLLSSII